MTRTLVCQSVPLYRQGDWCVSLCLSTDKEIGVSVRASLQTKRLVCQSVPLYRQRDWCVSPCLSTDKEIGVSVCTSLQTRRLVCQSMPLNMRVEPIKQLRARCRHFLSRHFWRTACQVVSVFREIRTEQTRWSLGNYPLIYQGN
ncbi:hypothetical protein J6590_026373 [Homalodisca vitripennis]|nr:hypothetical protein J6590_026373 [Homalodisca vitripennis]